jgi:hypothetical protein
MASSREVGKRVRHNNFIPRPTVENPAIVKENQEAKRN